MRAEESQVQTKCIFLDRDGTINRYVGFLRTVQQVELESSAAEAIKMINESEYLAIVVTKPACYCPWRMQLRGTEPHTQSNLYAPW